MQTVTGPALSAHQWAQTNFGNCVLGDKRRTKRLVRVAEKMADNPSASLPGQSPDWSDLKAAYRLFDTDAVTFQAIASGHWELTRQSATGRTLVGLTSVVAVRLLQLKSLARTNPDGLQSGGVGKN